MEMRRDWEGIPDKNKTDIEQMLSLLETKIEFDIVILYGRYAGGRMRSAQEGYEFLLLTRDDPTHEGWELEEFLKKEYPTESRAEWNLHIETVNIHTFNNINTASWFFWNIRMEGRIVYDSGNAPHRVFHYTSFKRVKAYKLARRQYDYFFIHGSDLLNEAERLWNEQKPVLAAINLSYAAQFLLRAEETVFYGNFIHTSELQKSFRRARVFSKKLSKAFNLAVHPDALFFEQLVGLRHAPLKYIDFVLPKWRYCKFLDKLRIIQETIRDSCQRHLSYLEHGKTKKQWMDLSHLDVESSEPIQESPDSIPIPEPAPATTPDSIPATATASTSAETETHAVPEDAQKKEPAHRITVEVDPTIAVIALGLAKGYLPSMIEQLEARSGLRMDSHRRKQMIDTLDTIYDRCIEKADLREVVGLFMRLKRDDSLS
ncbi:hypothetical protein [uncultured Parabacteroides sp.]|uniref:hypothetical protein n=1 Tax=uncultured Parabacteroides sp. TaxID=512312 RepID=UPI0026ECB7F4|nr:hypothetical protein [uncultured Parabacteroides sp.]